jgi:hypothetical protein
LDTSETEDGYTVALKMELFASGTLAFLVLSENTMLALLLIAQCCILTRERLLAEIEAAHFVFGI